MRYRKGVGIVVYNDEGNVFMGKRVDNPNHWQFPQGGMDEGENEEAAALRELTEETNITSIRIIKKSPCLRYVIPEDMRKEVPWGNEYQGQEQYWFAMEFIGSAAEIQLDKHHTPEFMQWQWVKPRESIDLVIPFKRELYQNILKAFADILPH